MSAIKKYIDFFKENKEIIILIPTIFGGVYQVLNIVILVGLPYVRYFSVSQVIPDGLLIIITTSCIYIIYKYLFYFYNSFIKKTPLELTHHKILYSIAALPLGVFFFYKAYQQDTISNFFIFLLRYFSFTAGILFIWASFKTLLSIIPQNNNIISKIKSYLEYIQYFISIILVCFITLFIPSEIRILNELFIKVGNFENYSYFSKNIQKTYNLKNEPTLLYINKDYAFFKVTKNEDKILVLDAKSLTEIKKPTK